MVRSQSYLNGSIELNVRTSVNLVIDQSSESQVVPDVAENDLDFDINSIHHLPKLGTIVGLQSIAKVELSWQSNDNTSYLFDSLRHGQLQLTQIDKGRQGNSPISSNRSGALSSAQEYKSK